jgi:uncharacterized membrane protein YgcG
VNTIIRWCCSILLVSAACTVIADTGIRPPDSGNWITDEAGLISDADAARIADLCETLHRDSGRPLFVVTINAMSAHGAPDASIERFARRLYEEWGARSDFAHAAAWRRGILLLVSKGDRKARIELGADWGGHFDSQCRQIMDWAIIPNFKRGDFSGGIIAGVTALDRLARDAAAPPPAPMTASRPEVPASGAHGPLPVSMPMPNSIPVHHGNLPAFQTRGRGPGGNPGSLFLLFFFLVPVLALVKMITGGRGGVVSHQRFDSHSFHGSGRRSFRRDDCGSPFDFGSHHSDSGFHSAGHGHSHSGGGGGASGSW